MLRRLVSQFDERFGPGHNSWWSVSGSHLEGSFFWSVESFGHKKYFPPMEMVQPFHIKFPNLASVELLAGRLSNEDLASLSDLTDLEVDVLFFHLLLLLSWCIQTRGLHSALAIHY